MYPRNKKLTIIITIIVSVVIIGLIALTVFLSSSSGAKDRIKINNYSTFVKNLPSSERDIIETALYDTVTMNVSDTKAIEAIDDAVIRADTYDQLFTDRIYTTTFTVDIESIKQSYQIKDLYSDQSQEQSGLYDYTTLALCLPKTELKYGEFVCQDRISQEMGLTQSDPILQYLPESTLDYTLSADPNSKDLHLIAKLILTEVDYRLGAEAAVDSYKTVLRQWFDSKNLDFDSYTITYEY